MDVRETALEILLEAEKTGAFAENLLRDALEKYDYENPRQKALLKRLTEGTLERLLTLDFCLDSVSSVKTERMKPLIRCLLRLSAYQILFLESVPDRAACSEAVRLAKKRGFSRLSGFVNGVLRSLAREKGSFVWPDARKEPVRALSVAYSVPEWIVSLWIGQYGQERTEKMLKALLIPRPVTIRFRSDITEKRREETVARFRERGITAERHPLYPGAWTLDGCEGVASLPGFSEGQFYAQDVSSMLAVETAGILPGMRIIDLCGSPGGKAVLAAEKAGREGRVLTGDISEKKTARIWENAERMRCENLEIRVWDAGRKQPGLEKWADVVLADVPCSGLGVLGRKKEIRYRVQPEDLMALRKLQREILTASADYVRPGGVLLYSTCTVNREENEEMVRFLTESFPFEAESLDPWLPECLHSRETKEGGCQLFAGDFNTDGFFMARLRRKQ
ncbi:MAG TPA: 16S rRNA (cytosine(967)-C(5))-methyltransferase RsmB [Candidatus Eisenbergiella pullicola]|nr:16S rRNA (cytosine(967)-C(5))-methyltransferase RsmB [Candidatus Eisenbergiella pullicola]